MDALFRALGDPTRRQLLDNLIESGSATATDLAAGIGISRQGATKHLTILAQADLVRSERSGREHRFTPHPGALDDLARWIESTQRVWQSRLDRLQDLLE